MTSLSAVLRILSGLAIVGTISYVGYVHRSPWVIPIFGVVFTALYINGKARQWRRIWREQGLIAIIGNLAVTFPVQIAMAAFFFFCGYGVGAVVHQSAMASEIAEFDYQISGGLLAAGLTVGLFINWLERDRLAPDAFDIETAEILKAVLALEGKTTCMPIEIFSLSRRLAELEDRSIALDLMEPGMFESDNAFVRRAAMTAIRFIGQAARNESPDDVDRRVIEGLADPDPWVRYDAAWAAGEIIEDSGNYATALNNAVAAMRARGEDEDETSAEAKALERALTSLSEIEMRSANLN